MNRKIKIGFLVLLVVAFFIVGVLVILQAQGYGFDWQNNKILKTGGIYIKTAQSGAGVFIDDKYINQTDMFAREVFAQNMLPGKHTVKVQKEGYFTWEKTLPVEEQMVAKAQNIILFPNNITFESIFTGIKSIYNIEEQKFLILKNSGDLIIFDSNENKEQVILTAAKLKDAGKFKKIDFSPDKKKALILSSNNHNYLLNLVENSQLTLLKDLDKITENIAWSGNNNLYYISKNKLYSLNISTNKKELIKKEDVSMFAEFGDGLYTIEDGALIRINTFTKNVEILSKPFSFKKDISYSLKIIEGRIFLVENNKVFYFYDGKEKIFTKVMESSSGTDYKILSDKVIFNTGYELWLMLLKDYESPFFAKTDSFVLLSNFNQEITDIVWVADDYFAAIINNKIRINEIDNRDKINSFELEGEGYINVWFGNNDKKLITLKDSNLYKSSQIIP